VTDKRFPSHNPKSEIRSPQFWVTPSVHAQRGGLPICDSTVALSV